MADANANKWKPAAALGLIAAVILLFQFTARSFPPGTGELDFLAYWSASHLLSQRQNFSNDTQLLRLQEQEIGRPAAFVMKAWNPPWVLAWLLPYALLPFEMAASWWLTTNVLLLFTSVILLWRERAGPQLNWRWLGLPLVASLLFPATPVAFVFGQTNLLVLAGLAGFLALYSHKHDLEAGMALAFTMAKPHLAYLSILLLLLLSVKERRWKVVAGFGGFLLVSLLVVFLLRPSFLPEYLASVASGRLLEWATPSLPTLIQVELGWPGVRLAGLILLPAVLILFLRWAARLSLGLLLDLSVLYSVITTPFGWSYDFVVLLLPLIRVWAWLAEGVLAKVESLLIAALLLLVYALFYVERIRAPSELYFFWIPLAVAGIYIWVWLRQNRREQAAVIQANLPAVAEEP